jgi:uncharacterized DUF497 family protein
MASPVAELLATEAAVAKLGARGISIDEAQQVPRNRHVIVRNPRETDGTRRVLIGRTNGERTLTLVIEPTIDPTTWLIVTGWEAAVGERRLLGG